MRLIGSAYLPLGDAFPAFSDTPDTCFLSTRYEERFSAGVDGFPCPWNRLVGIFDGEAFDGGTMYFGPYCALETLIRPKG